MVEEVKGPGGGAGDGRPKFGEVFNGEQRQVEREKSEDALHLFTDLIQHKTNIDGKVLPQGL